MTSQHYGAIAAVIVGYVVCRLLSAHVIAAIGSAAGHGRALATVFGVVVGLFPVAVLTVYATLKFRGRDGDRRSWVRVLALLGWLVAGGVLGILPYSRFGTQTNLLARYRTVAPGFLHALDITIVIDLAVAVALVLVSFRMVDPRRRLE